MFSITFKGKPNPKDKNWVKIEMVLFQTGYNRVPKQIEVTGLFKEWDQKKQRLNLNNIDKIERNTELKEIKKKYMKIEKEWED